LNSLGLRSQLSNRLELLQLRENQLREQLGVRYQLHRQLTQQWLEWREIELRYTESDVNLEVLQQSEAYAQSLFKQMFEPPVTEALRYIFGEDYAFQMEFTPAYATWRVQPKVQRGGVLEDPIKMKGRGIVNVLGTVLQVEFLRQWPERISGPLIFDEALAEVAATSRVQFLEYLKNAAAVLQRPVVLISHTPEVAIVADSVYKAVSPGIVERVK
jgi:hypothetical protein